jgi:hypothetical protein
MVAVKLVVDANTLSSDHYLGGPSFTVIANEIADGHLEVIVSEVAVIETVGNYRRSIGDAHTHLEKFSAKCKRLLPETSKVEALDTYLDDLAEAYEETLRRTLDELGARIEPIPDVDHVELVERAVQRRRPYDSSGNGYRDTLIWKTILVVAEEGDDIVFVTNDNDFTIEEAGARKLHPHLVEDLEQAGVDVTIVADLHDAIRQYLVQGEAEVADLAQQVRLELLNEWLWDSELYDEALQAKVDPEAAGLPRSTTGIEIEYVEDLSEVTKYSLLRKLGNSVLIEFEVQGDTAVDIWVDEEDVEEVRVRRFLEHGQMGQVRVQLVKPLNFDCLATLDSFGRPEALEITRVHADEDDPGLIAWDTEVCGCIRPPR